MPKTKTKKQGAVTDALVPLELGEVADLIQFSELSLGKKMGYLYMIARGTFSLDAYEDLIKVRTKALALTKHWHVIDTSSTIEETFSSIKNIMETIDKNGFIS